MPKAILELPEMPENCTECNLCVPFDLEDDADDDGYCAAMSIYIKHPGRGRRSNCPLKFADEHCQKADKTLDGKCRGFQSNPWNDEPAEMCKNCKDFELYEELYEEIEP